MTTRQNQQYIFQKPIQSKPVFGNITFGVVLFFLLFFTQYFVHAQARVTGHVFAEIVEPTALSARASSHHLFQGNDKAGEADLVLAEVKLSGGSAMNIGVSVQTNGLQAANGETVPFSAFACTDYSTTKQNGTIGEKVFTLKGTPGANIRLKKNNLFLGQYSVVFMYN